ncbi:hypothetical protein VNO77_23276 [Canavalia gladiata]|uniref:Uncharacterized protein n=1 Tax=Canavalia gladiata TaxID=3824 RepID=A0AAN9L455_CANGL
MYGRHRISMEDQACWRLGLLRITYVYGTGFLILQGTNNVGRLILLSLPFLIYLKQPPVALTSCMSASHS